MEESHVPDVGRRESLVPGILGSGQVCVSCTAVDDELITEEDAKEFATETR